MKSQIKKIFQDFEKNNISYCYIRDDISFENIFKSDGNDIDLFIENSNIRKTTKILNNSNFFNLFNHKGYIHIQQNIYFDLHKKTYERYPLINISKALNHRIKKDFYILNNIDLYKILLIHPMDICGFRGQRNYSQEKINYLIKNSHIIKDVSIELKKEFGNIFTNKLIKYIKRKDFKIIKKHNLLFKILMYLHNPKTLKYLIKRIKKKISKENYQKGKLIVFMGVDGSGKTTAAENTLSFLKRYYSNNQSKITYYYLGSLGGYILPLVQISNIKESIKKIFSNKQKNHTNNSPTAKVNHTKFKEICFFIEYLLRYIKLQYLLKLKNKIVISDRYLYDNFRTDNIDPKIIHFFDKLFPRPHYLMFMEGDHEIFYKRKKEYSPEQLKQHQIDLLDGLKKEKINHTKINANNSEETVLKTVLRALSE